MTASPEAVRNSYQATVENVNFQEAVDSDTAGIPHTAQRFEMMGQALAGALQMQIEVPGVAPNQAGQLRFAV